MFHQILVSKRIPKFQLIHAMICREQPVSSKREYIDHKFNLKSKNKFSTKSAQPFPQITPTPIMQQSTFCQCTYYRWASFKAAAYLHFIWEYDQVSEKFEKFLVWTYEWWKLIVNRKSFSCLKNYVENGIPDMPLTNNLSIKLPTVEGHNSVKFNH